MKKMWLGIAAIVALAAGVMMPAWSVYAEDPCNRTLGERPAFCPTNEDDSTLMNEVGSILNTVYFLVGILAVIFIIIGGINYTVSQGDPGKVKKAKNTILYAIVGLIVALMALNMLKEFDFSEKENIDTYFDMVYNNVSEDANRIDHLFLPCLK